MNRKADVLKKLEEQGLDLLPEIFDTLMEVARGTRILVRVEGPKPKAARFESSGRPIAETRDGSRGGSQTCPTCGRGLRRTDLGEPVEVWMTLPDTSLLRYLHEYLAGKAKVRSEQNIDPEIHVHFGPIDTVWSIDSQEEQIEEERAQEKDMLPIGA